MVTTLLLSSINKAVEMNISTRIALSLAFVGNHISERIVISSLPYLNTRWSFWEGNFYTIRAVSHNLISYKNNKSSFFDFQVALSHLNHFCCVQVALQIMDHPQLRSLFLLPLHGGLFVLFWVFKILQQPMRSLVKEAKSLIKTNHKKGH